MPEGFVDNDARQNRAAPRYDSAEIRRLLLRVCSIGFLLRSELSAIPKHYRRGQSAGHADVVLDVGDAFERVVDFLSSVEHI